MASKLRILVLLALLASLVGMVPTGGLAQSLTPPNATEANTYQPGNVLIKFAPYSILRESQEDARQRLRSYGAERLTTLAPLGIEQWRVPEGQELAIAALLNRLPGVEYAEPDYVVHALLTPTDPHYGEQWAHPMINSPGAWDVTTGSAAITVAILDTGVSLAHPEFYGRIAPGYDYANGDGDPDDDHGHGTHVAGIVGAAANNGIGVAGMAWNVRIMPIKVLDARGSGSHSDIANGIAWAVEHGAQIINLSLGGIQATSTLQEAIRYAVDRGVLVVAAAGNCGDANYEDNKCLYENQPVYPAAYAKVFAVAATTSKDEIASYSNQGSYVDVAAPGTNILSTIRFDYYNFASGTSQAAPFVSGLAALLWSMDPDLTAGEIEQIIKSTVQDKGTPGFDFDFGHGRIDAGAALMHLADLDAPVLAAIYNPDYDGDYDVTWSTVPLATRYTLQEDDNPTFTSPSTVYDGATPQALLLGRQPATWYYRVRAVHSSSGKTSAWSNTVSVRVGLDAPILLPIENQGQKDYRVSWQSVGGAAGYRLEEAGNATFTLATTHTTDQTYYDVTERSSGTWYYRVRAYTSGGLLASPWSAVQSAAVVPDAPASFTLTPSPDLDTYTLAWSTVAGATGYRLVQRATPTDTPVTRYEGTATTYTVTGQARGHWIYTVQAYNLAGVSAPSASQEITVTIPALPVPNLAPIDNADKDGSYTIQWTGVSTATLYTLEESKTPWFEAPTIAYAGPLTRTEILDQPKGHWYYRIRSHFPDGKSPWSAAASVLVPVEVHLPLILRQY